MVLYFGADYYPEHWPEERWAEDIELMSRAGFNVVRLAEFAWSRIEPREGEYDFEWLDRVVGMLSAKGIKCIIGTPTAAPPPWMIKAYPDILRVDGYGRRKPAGTRKNYCPNNPHYAEYSRTIVERMVLHYKDNPNIVGWQIDNEFEGDPCYCNNCIEAFRRWLKKKYGSLEQLNAACGLIFWGQEYGEWDEIFPPRPSLMMQNPSLNLEWRRFTSDSWVKYQQMQVELIRKHAPHQIITHNFMGMYKELDYFKFANPLDIVSFDYYPKWSTDLNYASLAMCHDIMRSLKKKPYWIMELQSGAVKAAKAPIPKPGQIRLWTIQSVARGADGVLYFRWRTCRFGAEEYWHGILDHDGVPRRRYTEIKKVSEELRKIGSQIEGTQVYPEAAVTLVYDNIWAWDIEECHGGSNYYGVNSWKPTLDFYSALYERNVPADFVNPVSEDLSKYKVVFVPSLMLMNRHIERNLRSYVKKGGLIIASPRTGAKDWNNNIIEETLPGNLSDMFGMTIEEYTGLPDGQTVDVRTSEAEIGSKGAYTCENWIELLSPREAEIAARYQTGIYEDRPAVTVNHFGDGTAVYVGSFLDKPFYSALVEWVIAKVGIEPVLPSAYGFEAIKRTSSDREIVFALNHNEKPVQVPCGKMELEDLISGEKVDRMLKIDGFDAKILKRVK